jgi:hypothetical protein
MTFDELRNAVAEINPVALLADGYEDALIGYVERFGQPPIALYDRRKCIEILMLRDRMSYNEAEEFFEFNSIRAWMGENTPAFATILSSGEKGRFTGLLDNCCLKINEGDLIRVGMRRGDDTSWSSRTERVVWSEKDQEWELADPKTGEKMQMQWDQELRAKVRG